jgi:transmembrane sensor
MSEHGTPAPGAHDPLTAEAAAWFARMRGPEAEESRAAFEAWLARGALHRAAYNRAAEIFAMGKWLADDPATRAAERRRRARLVLAGAAVLAIVLAIGWAALHALRPAVPGAPQTTMRDETGPQLLVTGAGERRLAVLADGSRVALAPDTRIAVHFGPAERRLALIRGGARFAVAHDGRTFAVAAGGGRIVARGTLFEIARTHDARIDVRLISGSIDVELPMSDDRAARPVTRRLAPGETLSFAAGDAQAGPGPQGGNEPPDSVIGAADYQAIRVADLIAIANRNTRHPIRLDDPAIGARRVSGRFRVDDPELLAARLAALFDLVATRDKVGTLILRGHPLH